MPNFNFKNLNRTFPIAVLLLTLASCQDSAKTTPDLSKNTPDPFSGRKQVANKPAEPPTQQLQDDWGEARTPIASSKSPAPSKPSSSLKSPGDSAAAPPAIAPDATSTWSLVVGTFTDTGHAEAAHQMVQSLRTIAPQAAGARVHTTAKGSMVVYGHYIGRDDPKAKADQDRLKAVKHQGQNVFDRVILTRLDLRLAGGRLHPHDLLSARRAHPRVDPLYSLEVAIWIANDDSKAGERITFDEIKQKAEAYAALLRSQGNEAYFYHDEAKQLSEVTVGLFDHTAINPISGLYSDDVRSLYKKFPARMANGEIMHEPIYTRDEKDPGFAKTRARAQTPVLVLVPTM